MTNLPRAEYPRPQFNRDAWVCLNGEWEFDFDDARVGNEEGWHNGNKDFSKRIEVPFSFESKLSGIGDPSFHDVVWYRRQLEIPKSFQGKELSLHFGAVDYEASVWLNGQLVATHEGGHTPFHADVTDALQADGNNTLVVKAVDHGTDVFLPRGKQFWEEKSRAIWYTRTTGIWQSVWMEAVAPVHLRKVKYVADIDANEIQIRSFVGGFVQGTKNVSLSVKISLPERLCRKIRIRYGQAKRAGKLSSAA